MPSSTSNIETALKRLAKENDLRGAKDEKGETVLHFAASQGCVGSCQFLVEELGLDVNSASKTGVTPMLFATFEGNVQVMRYLLGCGGDPAMPDETGCTPLHIAAEKGHCEAVRLLLSQGVCVDPIDHRGTPLHLADHDQVVKVLLEHGADPNRVAHHVFSPLMMAVCGKALKCMRLLIEAGADVNAHGYSGPTPLTEAVDDGLTDFVKVLLEAGADPNIPNQHGAIPIEVAAARGRRKLVEILFPGTKPISSLPDWSVDGIIRSFNSPHTNPGPATVSVEERIADLKSQGKEAFAKKDYLTAMYFYGLVMEIDPFDAAMFANRSLCWLRKGEGHRALVDAQQCKMMRPDWSKAWYREGAALSFMKVQMLYYQSYPSLYAYSRPGISPVALSLCAGLCRSSRRVPGSSAARPQEQRDQGSAEGGTVRVSNCDVKCLGEGQETFFLVSSRISGTTVMYIYPCSGYYVPYLVLIVRTYYTSTLEGVAMDSFKLCSGVSRFWQVTVMRPHVL